MNERAPFYKAMLLLSYVNLYYISIAGFLLLGPYNTVESIRLGRTFYYQEAAES